MMRSFLPALLLVITVCGTSSAPAATQGPLDGRWLTQDTRAIVEVAPCGTEECGKIVWVKDPINPQTGKPRVDRHNPDLALQHRPIIGLATLS